MLLLGSTTLIPKALYTAFQMHPKYVTFWKRKVYVGYTKGLPKGKPYRTQLKSNHKYCEEGEKYRFPFAQGRLPPELQQFLITCAIDKLYVVSYEENTEWSCTECERFQLCDLIAPITSQEQYELVAAKAKSKFIRAAFTDCCPCWCEFPGITK